MEEFQVELSHLDESQERVEAVSAELRKALDISNEDGGELAQTMIDEWMNSLRASDFQSERIAYLYVANHVLQKAFFGDNDTGKSIVVKGFQQYIEEAVSMVCNSPMDRQSVVRLLELWHENEVCTNTILMS